MARKSKIGKHGSGDGPETRDNAPASALPRRRNIKSVQADLRKNIGGSPDKAATPRAPSEKSDRLSLS